MPHIATSSHSINTLRNVLQVMTNTAGNTAPAGGVPAVGIPLYDIPMSTVHVGGPGNSATNSAAGVICVAPARPNMPTDPHTHLQQPVGHDNCHYPAYNPGGYHTSYPYPPGAPFGYLPGGYVQYPGPMHQQVPGSFSPQPGQQVPSSRSPSPYYMTNMGMPGVPGGPAPPVMMAMPTPPLPGINPQGPPVQPAVAGSQSGSSIHGTADSEQRALGANAGGGADNAANTGGGDWVQFGGSASQGPSSGTVAARQQQQKAD